MKLILFPDLFAVAWVDEEAPVSLLYIKALSVNGCQVDLHSFSGRSYRGLQHLPVIPVVQDKRKALRGGPFFSSTIVVSLRGRVGNNTLEARDGGREGIGGRD